MDKEALRAWRKQLGLSTGAFAAMLRLGSDRQVRRWEGGTHEVPGSVAALARVTEVFPRAVDLLLEEAMSAGIDDTTEEELRKVARRRALDELMQAR